MSILSQKLIKELQHQFSLDLKGIHGVSHWSRVRVNGLLIAKKTHARTDVIELFSFLHDSRRLSDHSDPLHGARAAEYADKLHGNLFYIDDEGLDLLLEACHQHSEGIMDADITIQTCWDADRLDLGRVGIKPNPDRMCTSIAKDSIFLEKAYLRSTTNTS